MEKIVTIIRKIFNFKKENPKYLLLPKIREDKLKLIKKTFETKAIEGHLFGSMARGDTDTFSDIDVWLIFKDEEIKEVLENRFTYYEKIGEIIHTIEAPQNSPINGIQTSVLYKTEAGLLFVDYSLCPFSTAFITKENKNLFGEIQLPLGEAGFNPQKVTVSETYRIDFFIGFIFNGIKKIIRKNKEGFDHTLKEYEYLSSRYGMDVRELSSKEFNFETLKEIIVNIEKVSTEKQKQALKEISLFLEMVNKSK